MRRAVLAVCLHQLSAAREISCKRTLGRVAKWNVAFFFPFATNQNCFSAQADIFQVDARKFRIADAASIKQFEHQPVALRKSRDLRHFSIDHKIHFFNGGHAGKFLRQLRSRYQLCRILLDHAFPRQPTIQRPHRRQRPCD